jgi:hypothetical protein
VLSREKLVVSPFDNSGRRFGGFGHVKRIDVPMWVDLLLQFLLLKT